MDLLKRKTEYCLSQSFLMAFHSLYYKISRKSNHPPALFLNFFGHALKNCRNAVSCFKPDYGKSGDSDTDFCLMLKLEYKDG